MSFLAFYTHRSRHLVKILSTSLDDVNDNQYDNVYAVGYRAETRHRAQPMNQQQIT